MKSADQPLDFYIDWGLYDGRAPHENSEACSRATREGEARDGYPDGGPMSRTRRQDSRSCCCGCHATADVSKGAYAATIARILNLDGDTVRISECNLWVSAPTGPGGT